MSTRPFYCSLIVFYSFLFGSEVYAETSTEDNFFDLSFKELMNVSVASQFEESPLEASSSVYVISKKDWQKKGARRTDELMTYQPGTYSHPTLGGSNIFAIRGFSNTLSVRGTATLLDGVPMNTLSYGTAQYFLANFDLGLLQRAEMIRGPASAVYGSDAFHGVFALQTFSASEDTVETEIGMGSPDYHRLSANFSHAAGSNTRIHGGIATTHQGNSQVKFSVPQSSAEGERADKYTSTSFFIKSDTELTDNWSGQLGFYYSQFDSDQFPGFGNSILGVNDLSDNDSSFYMLKGGLSRSLEDNKQLDLNVFYWQTEQEYNYPFPLIPIQAQDDRRYGLSSTIKQPGDDNNLRWLIGAGYDKAKVTDTELINGEQAFDGLDRHIWNIYGEIRQSWFDNRLSLEIGGRYDRYSDFGGEFTPRAGLIYHPDDQSAIKLLYGEAFRAPVGSELTSSGRIEGNPNLNPETIKTYELVFMRQTPEHQASLTFFHSKWKNAIIIIDHPNPQFTFDSMYENQGKFESQGIEAELGMSIDNWQLDSALSYVKSKNEQTRDKFTAFPEYILNLDIGYHWQAYKTNLVLSNYAYFNTTTTANENSDSLGTILNSNLNISYEYNRQITLALDIRNVFNRKDNIPSLWGNNDGLPMSGTEFSAYLRYHW